MAKRLWGGRFEGQTHKDVEDYTFSLESDSRLWKDDILGSIAHARMLGVQKIISNEESIALIENLTIILHELESEKASLPEDAEDIHSALEQMLYEKAGTVAGKLHTARSRNDQVATTSRLYLRSQATAWCNEMQELQRAFLDQARQHVYTILPGLTHLQHAQPVSLAHHLMAYFWMFQRDISRIQDCVARLNQLPLGSGALAGTTLPIERTQVAKELGFLGVCENSLDAVSDRDFIAEFLSVASIAAIHFSRFSEELIQWSAPEYGFAELSDDVTTGSSLMPQKKNPDVAELIRGRTGRVIGSLMGTLTMLKGLPLSYNRDLQEDKEHLFKGLDSIRSSTRLMRLILTKISWNPKRMAEACYKDYSNSTDLADYLVKKNVPFRQTHEIAGKAVRLAIQKQVALEELSLQELQQLNANFEADIFDFILPKNVMERRNSRGGTGPTAVLQQLEFAQELLKKRAES